MCVFVDVCPGPGRPTRLLPSSLHAPCSCRPSSMHPRGGGGLSVSVEPRRRGAKMPAAFSCASNPFRRSASAANLFQLCIKFCVFDGERVNNGFLISGPGYSFFLLRRHRRLRRTGWRDPIIASQSVAGLRHHRAFGSLSISAVADHRKRYG